MPTWRERIALARDRGSFTDDDIRDAASWLTCAVSEQPQAEEYQHLKNERVSVICSFVWDKLLPLAEPGQDFYNAVKYHECDRAESLLDRIEDESARLKRERPKRPS